MFLAKLISCIIWMAVGNATQPIELWVNYTASFGRQGADCAGRGVCSFVENATDGNVRLNYSPADSVMTMQIINSKMEPGVMGQQITPGPAAAYPLTEIFFEMEGDYVLPATVKGPLGIQKGLQRIPPGKYKAAEANGFTIVQFKLK